MSTLYIGADQDQLAERLAAQLEEDARGEDFFAPAWIIVPNRYLGRWLRLWLARRNGVVINVRVDYLLEAALWEMLREADPRTHAQAPDRLSHSTYRLLVLAGLLDADADTAELKPFRDYTGAPGRREFWRRSWQLADRLAGLYRDYEYHRQDALVRRWVGDIDHHPTLFDSTEPLERAQRELYRLLFRKADGLLATLNRSADRHYVALPQYAREVMAAAAAASTGQTKHRVHLFGISQISALHIRILRWLGQRREMNIYHSNPLAGRLGSLPRGAKGRAVACELADRFRGGKGADREPAFVDELLIAWARAGAESLHLMADLLQGPHGFSAELLNVPARSGPTTVLGRLQDDLLGRTSALADRLEQDISVQVAACPGIYREVETVYQSVLHNLQQDPTLKQTDVAVLVTDMPRYRPVIQAVFDRAPQHLQYNLADFSAAGLSSFGQGLVGMLDLALESFTRSRVFELLLNRCFLARLGVERDDALKWLVWAEQLGIYHCWDASDKRSRGYADSPLYTWRHGLQRLRLGRLMEPPPEDGDALCPPFHGVIPFADLVSGDRAQLDAFCRAIEGLLPVLHRLRDWSASGAEWASAIRSLVQTFLTVPPDQPDEEEVQDKVFEELRRLELVDRMRAARGGQTAMPLALLRELLHEALACVEGTKGDYLTGGVTISALQPLRPVPFQMIYVLGLGEELFPGSDRIPAFDLRSRERCEGDIRAAESNRFLFLEALMAARRKVCLLYTSRDLQKDQDLHPSSPVNQLMRYLSRHVLQAPFAVCDVPLKASDIRCVGGGAAAEFSDLLVNYSHAERLLAFDQARLVHDPRLDSRRKRLLENRLRDARRDFVVSAVPAPVAETRIVRIADLRAFLRCPAECLLRRRLQLSDLEDVDLQDDEPFCTTFPHDHRLVVRALEDFVTHAVSQSVEQACGEWRERFARRYSEWRLRGRLPDGGFAQSDRRRFEDQLRQRIAGSDGLAAFLGRCARAEFSGAMFLGDNPSTVRLGRRFPALRLTLPTTTDDQAARNVQLIGTLPFVWRSDDLVEMLTLTTAGIPTGPDELCKPLLEPWLFSLALQAGNNQGPEGPSAEWLGDRTIRVHVAHAEGINTFTYPKYHVSRATSTAYLEALTADFLRSTTFDLLPFEIVIGREFRQAYVLADDDPELATSRAGYADRLQRAIEQDQQKDGPNYQAMRLFELVQFRVPADAFDKVRRRLRPMIGDLACVSGRADGNS
jgi:exonuclease V gamma subunit